MCRVTQGVNSKSRNPKKYLGLQTKHKKFLDQNLTPKKSHAEFPTHKNFERNNGAGIHGNYHIITPQNPYLNQATKKNTCQNFPIPKNLAT